MIARAGVKILGVDPGLHGGMFVYNTRGRGADRLDYAAMPTLAGRVTKTRRLNAKGKPIIKRAKSVPDFVGIVREFDRLCAFGIDCAYLEQVAARPGQGSVSMFNFGYVYGFVRGLIMSRGIRLTLVRPQVWHEEIGIPKDADKKASRELATRLFGLHFSRVKDEGIAEAALIAHYGELDVRKASA